MFVSCDSDEASWRPILGQRLRGDQDQEDQEEGVSCEIVGKLVTVDRACLIVIILLLIIPMVSDQVGNEFIFVLYRFVFPVSHFYLETRTRK